MQETIHYTTNDKFVPFGSDINNVKIHTAGKITCVIESKSCYATADFYIIKTKSHNLIGGILAIELNLLNLNNNSLTFPHLYVSVKLFECWIFLILMGL